MAVILPPLISIQGRPVTKGSYLALLCTRPLLGVSSHHEQCGLWSQTDEGLGPNTPCGRRVSIFLSKP